MTNFIAVKCSKDPKEGHVIDFWLYCNSIANAKLKKSALKTMITLIFEDEAFSKVYNQQICQV